ncbi:hypothetical protein GBAR_LOCUS4480 [Geodia barretti]|uniref:Uncharacterized protein n=1 Tax=Geodia barretti TaxID=519541 RepID=A0AA35R7N3_GEOBA|nr:hypothetical protein GBAR_LOCUS4480 [Geodia barretti]
MARNWLQTRTREELQQTIGWGDPPVVSSRDKFSAHHPMIPRRYVPAWQLDMQNRGNIIKNCELAGNSMWRGHISYFLNGRERLSATRPVLYSSVLNYSRTLNKSSSPLSRYNSSVMTMTS